jgi:hypothetical protein
MSTKSTLKLTLAAFAAVLSIGNASAQSSTTPTIGYYKQTFPVAGAYAMAVGFVNRTEFQGQATTAVVTGSDLAITQTGAGWTAGDFDTFATGSSHYIEVLNSDTHPEHVGLILDITANTGASLNVLVPTGFTPGANFQYAVRKHVTLGELLNDASGVVASTDLAVFYAPDGSEVYASYDGGGVWSDLLGSAADYSNYVIYPGTGFQFLPGEDGRTLTIGGGAISYVKSGPTRVSLIAGVSTMVGAVNPLVPSGPTDPIYSTSGRNSLTALGLRVVGDVNKGMLADTDLAIIISDDGTFSAQSTITKDSSSNDLVELLGPTPAAGSVQNNLLITNGQSLFLAPGDNSSLLIPQLY